MSELVLNDNDKKELPSGWKLTMIGDIVSLINGRAFKPEDWSNNGLPIVRIQNLNDPDKPFNYCNFEVDEKFLIDNGQLLFAWSGTPGTSFGTFIWNRGKAVLNQHIFRIEINEKFQDKKYLLYAINQNLDKYISKAHGTAGLAHITKGMFEEGQILLPPLNEQKKIVTKIEELFSLIDSMQQLLKNIKNQLKQQQQSLLKQAFEGKLVPQDPNDKPNTMFLEKIKYKQSSKSKKQADLNTSESILGKNNENRLPNNWISTTIDHIIASEKNSLKRGPFGSTIRKEFFVTSGFKIYEQKNVIYNDFSLGNYFIEKEKFMELKNFVINSGDILISCAGTIGKIAVVPEHIQKGIINQALLKIRLDPNLVVTKYFLYLFGSNPIQKRILHDARGSAMKNFASIKELKQIKFPLPPLNEQKRIVTKIEESLSLIEKNDKLVGLLSFQITSIKKSILRQAFEGKLVPQDPNDEPAEILLQKIRQEKQKIISQTKRGKKNDK